MTLVPHYIEKLEPYKAGGTIQEIRQRFGLDRIIKLASNENPFGPSPRAIEAMQQIMGDLHRYPDSAGTDLRDALAEKFKVKPGNVVLGSGSEGIMSNIMRTFLAEGDEIITSAGTFIGFKVLANASGKKTYWVPLNNYRFELKAMIPYISQKTKIIYLCNPNNPTGTIFTRSEFDAFYKHVPDRVLIILDEAYFEFAQSSPDYPDSMHYRYDNVITLRTFSKAHGLAGVRVGYGMAHDRLISNLMKVKLPFEPNTLAQVAALASMKDTGFVDTYIRTNQEALEQFYKLFEELDIPHLHSYANFVTIDLGTETAVQAVHLGLLKKGIMVRPLTAFDLPTCLRITTGLPDENAEFIRAFREVYQEMLESGANSQKPVTSSQ